MPLIVSLFDNSSDYQYHTINSVNLTLNIMQSEKNISSQENIIRVAVDALIFTIKENLLHVLLVQIRQGPYDKKWALPGGLIKADETLDQAAKRILKERAGIQGVYLEQLYSFGEVERDVRGRSISVAYFALVHSDIFRPKAAEYYADCGWREVDMLPPMAFDHKKIIEYGVERLRSKIEYSNIVYGLLPKEFTLTELQNVYEAILGKKLDKRNFRKRVLMIPLVEPTHKTRVGKKNRPAQLYRFKKRQLMFTK